MLHLMPDALMRCLLATYWYLLVKEISQDLNAITVGSKPYERYLVTQVFCRT